MCRFLLSCLDGLAKEYPQLTAEHIQLILDFAEKHISYYFPALSASDRAIARQVAHTLPRCWNLCIC